MLDYKFNSLYLKSPFPSIIGCLKGFIFHTNPLFSLITSRL